MRQLELEKLEGIRREKEHLLGSYLQKLEEDLTLSAINPFCIEMAKGLNQGFLEIDTVLSEKQQQQDKEDLIGFMNEMVWSRIEDEKVLLSVKDFPTLGKSAGVHLQATYMARNPFGLFEKEMLDVSPSDTLLYDQWHRKCHAYFRKYKEDKQYHDILLVNPKGDIIYSVNKQIDFGTNLLAGPFKDSHLADLFLRAQTAYENQEDQTVFMKDVQFYTGNYGIPLMLAAIPIVHEQQGYGVLIFSLDEMPLNRLMLGKETKETEEATYDAYLVGKDEMFRSSPSLFQESLEEYVHEVMDEASSVELYHQVKKYNTAVLAHKLEGVARKHLKERKQQAIQGKNYLGEEVLSVYTPLEWKGNEWGIIIERPLSVIQEKMSQLAWSIAAGVIVVVLLVAYISIFLISPLKRSLMKVKEVLHQLFIGEIPEYLPHEQTGDIGQIKDTINSLVKQQQEYIQHLHGMFSDDIGAMEKSPRLTGGLGKVLYDLKEKIHKTKEREKEQQWMIEGKDYFSTLLRRQDWNVSTLLNTFLPELLQYVGIEQGAIYMADETGLELVSCYASQRKKYLNKRFAWDESLVGRSYQEEEVICIDHLPEEYGNVLLGGRPIKYHSLLLLPLKINTQVLGVVELLSVRQVKAFEIELLQRVLEIFTAALSNLYQTERINHMLEQQQLLNEELRVREEELVQSTEEMQVTQLTLSEQRSAMEKKIMLLEKEVIALKAKHEISEL
ncbi:hypothetical protein GCM10023331_32190 [Algivirga pacifica]|uniref:GAF domain-containing protein n=2 Tax=Algivirga pacifica TaxID=1162670 RepID=A0ABP9DHT7_9BACT